MMHQSNSSPTNLPDLLLFLVLSWGTGFALNLESLTVSVATSVRPRQKLKNTCTQLNLNPERQAFGDLDCSIVV